MRLRKKWAKKLLNETKDLASEGLAQLLQITTDFQIEYAPIGSFVTLYPPGHSSGNAPNDSMYVDFSLQFNLSGIESMDVSIDSVGLSVPNLKYHLLLQKMRMEAQLVLNYTEQS